MSLVEAPTAASRNVTFRTDDGVTLAGTWYEPSGRTGPAVILVHMLHRSRRDWDALAIGLASEGIGVLAFDLRGHGESTGTISARRSVRAVSTGSGGRATIRRQSRRRDPSQGWRCWRVARRRNRRARCGPERRRAVAGVALRVDRVSRPAYRWRFEEVLGRALLVYSDDDPYAQRSARDLIKLPARIRRLARPSRCTMPDTAPPCSPRTRPCFPR